MQISEIYKSIQGEGALTGTPSVFVRTSGCNLRCWYCDTPYTSWSPEGQDIPVDEITAQVEEWDCPHVVLTGGEPMLQAELIPLCQELAQRGRHLTVETAGTLYLPVECDLMSISPKLRNSTPTTERDPRWSRRHNRDRHAPAVMARLLREYNYQLKFVIDTHEDCDEVAEYLTQFPTLDMERVLLMPQGVETAALAEIEAWLVPLCEERGWRFCPRKQIEWFGPVRGT
jgi:7-carboxy-7-deazaguanine synthase